MQLIENFVTNKLHLLRVNTLYVVHLLSVAVYRDYWYFKEVSVFLYSIGKIYDDSRPIKHQHVVLC